MRKIIWSYYMDYMSDYMVIYTVLFDIIKIFFFAELFLKGVIY